MKMLFSLGEADHENCASLFEAHLYEDISPFSDSQMKQHYWFHGGIDEDQAEALLSKGESNRFLVRSTLNGLVLSLRISGWSHHLPINHTTPEGFCYLRRKNGCFKSIAEMIAHYQRYPIDFITPNQTLGHPSDRKSTGTFNAYKYIISN